MKVLDVIELGVRRPWMFPAVSCATHWLMRDLALLGS
jgi:hypothetical protein